MSRPWVLWCKNHLCKNHFLLLVGLSPVGFPVQHFLIWELGYCHGALGSGVTCNLPFLNSYFKDMALVYELSFFILVGVVWVALAVYVWYKIIASWTNAGLPVCRAIVKWVIHPFYNPPPKS